MSADALQALREARALIQDPERWTRGVLARDANGREVDEHADAAVCWCLEGAVARVCAQSGCGFYEAWGPVRSAAAFVPLAEFNDSHSHADVLAVLDKAIARLESEAA